MRAFLTWDRDRIYFAIQSESPPRGTELVSRVRKHDGPVWIDDAVEIWLKPDGERMGPYFQFVGNSKGVFYDVAFDPSLGQPAKQWEGRWDFSNSVGRKWWVAEASIPWSSLGLDGPPEGGSWRVNLCRDFKNPPAFASWSGARIFSNPDTMGVVNFDPQAPVVQLLSLGEILHGRAEVKVRIYNPTARPIGVKARLSLSAGESMVASLTREIRVKPEEAHTLVLRKEFSLGKRNSLDVYIASLDGRRAFYRRSIPFAPAPRERWWPTEAERRCKVEALFLPYLKRLWAEVDIQPLLSLRKVEQVEIKLKDEEGRTLARGKVGKFEDGLGHIALPTPSLSEGKYEVEAVPLYKGRPVERPLRTSFSRRKFEWEGNKLGLSPMVIKPFTPLKARRERGKLVVECWGRRHVMNGFGLWKQVESLGVPLLVGPMELVAIVEGRKVGWSLGAPHLIEAGPTEVRIRSVGSCKSLSFESLSTFDYDGFMLYKLRLRPRGEGRVDRLLLRIPVRGKVAKLMHACGDTLRTNYAGKVPKGEGVVWDSSKIVNTIVRGSFCASLFLGDELRGICWLSDSDRGWVVDKEVPEMVVRRGEGEVVIEANLVAKPTKLKEEREIAFALQATPVKPMPKGWRGWHFGWGVDFPVRVRILGSSLYWGAVSPFGDMYPKGRDFSIFEAFFKCRKTGEVDEEAQREWLSKFPGDEYHRRHIRGGFSVAATTPLPPKGYLIPYTNARGIRANSPEFLQFKGEWATWPYQQWGSGNHSEVRIQPVRSFRDFALFYFEKMVRTGGVDGIYLDNTFPAGNANLASGCGFKRGRGEVQGSVGVFDLRQYIKRLAVCSAEMGRRPMIIVHMTNTFMPSVYSFATVTLDWEMKYGRTPFPLRFPSDFVRAESLGQQAGCVPLVLGGITGAEGEELRHLTRTQMGWILVHGIKLWYGARHDVEEAMRADRALANFKIWEPNCKWIPYWEGPPVKAEGKEALVSCYLRPGRMLVIVANPGRGGKAMLKVDLKSAGLPREAEARDAITGERIPPAGPGRWEVEIPDYEYRILEVWGG